MFMKKERNIFMTKAGDSPTTKKTIHELVKEFPNKSYKELEKYRSDADQLELIKKEIRKREQEELEPIQREIRWREKYEKEHRLRQEAETETILIKGIGMNSPEMKAAKAKITELQKSMDRLRKENSELYNRIADLIEDPLKKARESGL
tara:strand:+ start:178 stop:624 length:447 start_codon:yes stop_codon:yes gene_type:complete